MIVTDDDTFAATCRALRSPGAARAMRGSAHHRLGYNYRLSEMPPPSASRRRAPG
jgi:dTDP-4-amino-4,6-dideoxygalactose transaminase